MPSRRSPFPSRTGNPSEGSPVKVRATLTLDLTAEDAAKAERFTESRRAARLDEALARDHMKFLREVALADEDTARLWWLHCNLAGDDPGRPPGKSSAKSSARSSASRTRMTR